MRTVARSSVRLLLVVGALVGLRRALTPRRGAAVPWEPRTDPMRGPLALERDDVIDLRDPIAPRRSLVRVPTFAEPVDGDCPPGYPVKGKLSSGIYHVPGGLSYARTVPDRCYASAADAEADGLRIAKK